MTLIRPYAAADKDQLVAFWRTVFPDDPPHNEPARVIEAKLKVDEFLFVAAEGAAVVGSVMAGYDGHRGWLYSVAVHPSARRQGLGTRLVHYALEQLGNLGCIKVNLQVRASNSEVVAFYRALGFRIEERISMGLLLKAPAADAALR
jgi:ribosomal protein S18 acetylase RimI-like enzyme